MFKTIVVGRSGESMAGDLREKTFTIESTLGPTLTFKTKDIRWIHFKNPPNIELDEIWGEGDDRVRGKISGDSVHLRVTGGATVEIPYSRIHTIIVNQAWNPGRGLPRV